MCLSWAKTTPTCGWNNGTFGFFFVKWLHEPCQLDQLSDNKAGDTESEVEKEKDEDDDLVASEELEDDTWENAPKASMNSLNALLFQLAANSFIKFICCQCSHDFKQHILHWHACWEEREWLQQNMQNRFNCDVIYQNKNSFAQLEACPLACVLSNSAKPHLTWINKRCCSADTIVSVIIFLNSSDTLLQTPTVCVRHEGTRVSTCLAPLARFVGWLIALL